MKTLRSTRQALHAAIEMAAAPPGGLVTAAEVAERYNLPPAVVAKIFQRLARVGIAAGTRGIAGGYRLAKPASKITLLEVIEAFERLGSEPSAGREKSGAGAERRLEELLAEIDEQLRATLASVTLETVVAPRRSLGAADLPAARAAGPATEET